VTTLERPYGILVTGIGGTGVITVGALLGMAAHLEGKGCTVLDFTGLAQKNGAVMSHVRLAPKPEDLHAVRIAAGESDLVLGCDMVVAASPAALATYETGRSYAVINSALTPTASFVVDRDTDFKEAALRRAIRVAAGDKAADFVDATGLATALLGDAIATNLFMLGYAFQKGLVPLSLDSILRAIELNGVSVATSKATFGWGRRAAHDIAAVEEAARPAMRAAPKPAETLAELVARRVTFLTQYQDAAYAERYRRFVAEIETAERANAKGQTGLAEAAAKNLFKLMAYKDEYEVARLYSDGAFVDALKRSFETGESGFKLEFHLAPPLLAPRDPVTGELQKRAYGPWVLHAFRLLAKLKGLRGTKFDIFGRTEERRSERRLIAEYETLIADIARRVTPATHSLAVALASIPDAIRGYGHVKAKSIADAKTREAELRAAFDAPPAAAAAAE
jgi:indolepyruvate ferredoxin oxidoreductase